MANVTITNDNDFKKIYLSSDSATMNADYPVVLVYIQEVLRYTLVVGGSVSINGVDYETTGGAQNLDWTSTLTSIGTRYIEEISAATFGLTEPILEDGLWKFVILANGTGNIYVGTIMHNELDSCISNKLDVAYDETNKCDVEKVEALTLKSWALLQSSKDSASVKEWENAKFKFDLAKSNCNKDCNC